MEFDWLKIRARNVDMFVGSDIAITIPVHGGGDLYLEVKERAGIREPAILTFATEDEVHAALARIEKQLFRQASLSKAVADFQPRVGPRPEHR